MIDKSRMSQGDLEFLDRVLRDLASLARLIDVQKWTAALRSGKYRQGRKYLEKDDEFCCLGVMCLLHPKLFRRAPLGVSGEEGVMTYTRLADPAIDPDVALPKFSVEDGIALSSIYLPIQSRTGWRTGELEYWSLAGLNDSGQFSFDQIADLIDYFVKP